MIAHKTKEKKSILVELRTIRDNISNELRDKTPEEIVSYLKNKNTLHPASVLGKQK